MYRISTRLVGLSGGRTASRRGASVGPRPGRVVGHVGPPRCHDRGPARSAETVFRCFDCGEVFRARYWPDTDPEDIPSSGEYQQWVERKIAKIDTEHQCRQSTPARIRLIDEGTIDTVFRADVLEDRLHPVLPAHPLASGDHGPVGIGGAVFGAHATRSPSTSTPWTRASASRALQYQSVVPGRGVVSVHVRQQAGCWLGRSQFDLCAGRA